ncbi:MAG TPA: hypothetical protein VER57_05515 [Cyanobium sp.]|nr:hypothetical protein [Cyanobium sp.]
MAFAHLIRVWHARNGWSHRVLPGLADALDLGRVHNSQLSMLRNGKLASPGPEVFLALGGVNQWLAAHGAEQEEWEGELQRLAGHPELIEALQASALPLRDEAGRVFGPGELLEVFVGLCLPPPGFDLRIDEAEAGELSGVLATLLTAERPWRQCRDTVMAAYPVGKRQRRERFAEVMAGQSDYAAPELDAELPDLCRTLAALGAAGEKELAAETLLELLREHVTRERARLQGQAGEERAPLDLAAAIRLELRPPVR